MGLTICKQKPGAGVCSLHLLYGAKTPRLETVSGGGLLCDSGGVCLSLSACRTMGAGSGMAQGAAGTFEQVFETSVREGFCVIFRICPTES